MSPDEWGQGPWLGGNGVSVASESRVALREYAGIPIAFQVRSVLDVDRGADGFTLTERLLAPTIVKNYDIVPGEGPDSWESSFDLDRWGFMVARAGDEAVGAAAMVYDTPGLALLEGRRDLAAIWDIRVAPAWRRRGVGTDLFAATERWARARDCTALKVETQNINVAACRFYEKLGCELRAANRDAYPRLKSEVQLLWYKEL
jgi:ribosomal protein S18 acetylase RimI-like enzyme